jgi:FkbM family methyltransferase
MKHANLIIDVGMHDGQDTAFYLSKGFNVVAIEANPALADAARRRFASSVESGQLQILSVAISEREGALPFAVADDMTIWSSLSESFVERNRAVSGTRYRYIEVPTRPFESVLEEVGIPRYVKIDIEGLDMLCVRALRKFDERPDFVSLESNVSSYGAPFDLVFDELAELWSLGYRRFAYVNQRDNPKQREPNPAREGRYAGATFTSNHSGLFGEELPTAWEPVARTLLRAQLIRLQHNTVGYGGRWTETRASRLYSRLRLRLGGQHSWYDLHARLS